MKITLTQRWGQCDYRTATLTEKGWESDCCAFAALLNYFHPVDDCYLQHDGAINPLQSLARRAASQMQQAFVEVTAP